MKRYLFMNRPEPLDFHIITIRLLFIRRETQCGSIGGDMNNDQECGAGMESATDY